MQQHGSKYFAHRHIRSKGQNIIANTRFFTLDLYLEVKVTQNAAQYPLYYVTYAHSKFEVAISNGVGAAFTRKYIIWL